MSSKPSTATQLLSSLAIGLFCLNVTVLAQSGAKETKRIKEITGTLKAGDESAIRELADLVWNRITNNDAPRQIATPVKERLVRAEINYRNGHSQGIPENRIVDVVSYLARQFDAPVYAQAQLEEVHALRLGEAYVLFHSLAPNLAAMSEAERRAVPLEINPTMSPIEAAYFALRLVFQKQWNPCGQLTAGERSEVASILKALEDGGLSSRQDHPLMNWALCNREADPVKLHLTPEELAVEVKTHSAEHRPVPGKPYLMGLPSSARYQEMQAVFQRAYSMKLDDALVLMNQSLDLLGVEK